MAHMSGKGRVTDMASRVMNMPSTGVYDMCSGLGHDLFSQSVVYAVFEAWRRIRRFGHHHSHMVRLPGHHNVARSVLNILHYQPPMPEMVQARKRYRLCQWRSQSDCKI